MAYLKSDLTAKVDSLFKEEFKEYESETVPDISDSRLTHGATGISGEYTFLYADMRESSSLTNDHRRKTISKIYKAFHHCMVETIKYKDGKVRSFDGDRVLGIFDGSSKANNAVYAAMFMVGCLTEILKPKIEEYYKNETFEMGIGVATGKCMCVKAGVGYDENNRDLVWIGDAPNLGAKLSNKGSGYFGRIIICSDTYSRLVDDNIYHINEWKQKINMWNTINVEFGGSAINAYQTKYLRKPF